MNGGRRFLLGTVLSVQNSGFIYPACQNCCSRLSLTSCRYECHKCGCTYKDAAHRYKLSVKVSEENRLHVITVFGKCLEKIFGASADFVHSHLQVSSQVSGEQEHDRAQDLFFQAAERCLIGRSFIFAVKIPGNFARSNSFSHSNSQGNLVACQIILLREDPMSCTVLSYFNQLVASALSNKSIHPKSDVSTDTTNGYLSDQGCSESSSGLYQSWNHYADYWQQSLGLVSSSTGSTLDECQCCNYRQSDGSRAEQAPYTTQYMKEKLKGTDMTGHSSSSSSVKSSPSKHTITRSPQTSSHFHSFASKSEMAPGQESQNVCKSGSRPSQSCSALSMQFPPQTAETHQAMEEIWEEFPFSESLSEFIAKIEDDEGVTHLSSANKSKMIAEEVLGAQITQNDGTGMIKASRRHSKSITCNFSHHPKGSTTDDTILADQTFPSTILRCFQELESFEKNDLVSRNSIQNQRSPTYLKTLSNRSFSDDGCSSVDHVDNFWLSSEKEISRGSVDQPKSSGVDMATVSQVIISAMADDGYDASADLFEASNNLEDGSSILKSPNRRLQLCTTDSPCTEVLPYLHKDSRISICSLSENCNTWNNMTMGGFLPNLQSTPVLRRRSESGRLTVGSWRFNVASSSKSTFSVRTKSSSTIGHIVVKNTKRRKSTVIFGLSENGSFWSPDLSPFSHFEGSTILVSKNRRRLLALEPQERATSSERKENSDGQRRGCDDDLTCTVKRIDRRENRREESMKHGGDTLDNVENRSAINSEDLLLPTNWSPELFSEKSDISRDCLQKRLF
ncbi:DNA damage-induced apoptosis suppressor protein [Anomaloglossus baeobatrachus]|uniref:DNA damage-induced apoptosis suppressor protein n=1 Tax=Anomaloglossus baeobatrachus TaxID=238106 RepID=UPI003F4F5EE2